MLITLFILSFGFTHIHAQSTNIASQLVGTYKGKLRSKTFNQESYLIKVTRISNDSIRVQPKTGNQSASFTAKVEEKLMGSMKIVQISIPGNALLNNGTFVQSNGLLTYMYHKGGDDDHNIEVYTGEKQ